MFFAIIMGVLCFPIAAIRQAEGAYRNAPPIAQPLIREGEFAVQLVEKLQLGTTDIEGEAEGILVASDIEPRNGWISDYPVTPDIIDEIEKSVAAAADSGQLAMGRDEAVQAVEDLAAELGLPVLAADEPNGYAGNDLFDYLGSEAPDSSAVENYYNSAGPPVVTYYSPPAQFYDLYAWVSYPFWCNQFFFPGFFILHDFHKTVIVHKRPFLISNRIINPVTKAVITVDPTNRFQKITASPQKHEFKGAVHGNPILPHKEFASPHGQRGALVPGNRAPREMDRGFSGRFGGSSSGGGSFPRGGCIGRC